MGVIVVPRDLVPTHIVTALERLYQDCPQGMDAFFAWIASTEYGSVTLHFTAGKLRVVDRTQTVK